MRRKKTEPLETKCVKYDVCAVKHFCDSRGMIIVGRKIPIPCEAYADSFPVRYWE